MRIRLTLFYSFDIIGLWKREDKEVVKMSNKEYFAYMDKWLEKKRKELQPPKTEMIKKEKKRGKKNESNSNKS